MKFLIYGSAGWLGESIARIITKAGDEVIHGGRVNSIQDVTNDLQRHHPDRVICSLGRTHGAGILTIDYLEGQDKLLENIMANLTAPIYIAQATESVAGQAIPMLYIGSGCIFEYDKNHPIGGKPFTEQDAPNFFGSSYSTVKGQTDQLMGHFAHVICARVRMPISDFDHPRDFISKLVSYKKILSIPNSMTILSDWMPFLVACLVDNRSGILNSINPGAIDHKTILDMHRTIRNPSHTYQPMNKEEHDRLLKAGRSNNFLDSSKAERWLKEVTPESRGKYGVIEHFGDIETRIRDVITARARHDQGTNPRPPWLMLVTGGAGFIGSNFINFWMEKHPDDVIVNFDCLEHHSNVKNVKNTAHPNYTFVHGNLIDQPILKRLFAEYAFTHIIHFAAASNVDESFACPVKCTNSNVVGTHCLLEVARSCPSLKVFLHISTDEVYGEMPIGDCVENGSTFAPTNPYAASKAGAECLVMSYGKSFKLPFIITRANNVYGICQYPAQAIPNFITCLMNEKKMPVHGAGRTTRKFMHVLDKCAALEILLIRGKIGEVYNIGTTNEVSVMELCRRILSLMKGPQEPLDDWIVHVKDRSYNDCRYSVSTTKIEQLGWKPVIPFDQGLMNTVTWYKANATHWTARPKHQTANGILNYNERKV